MRIGIDFDNTIICYDTVFCTLAKTWQLVPDTYQGSKQQLRDHLLQRKDGEQLWMRLQGKVYGEFIDQAILFTGFRDFLQYCHQQANLELFIVSHKTQYGHFDEKQINLRDAAQKWLLNQGLIGEQGFIPVNNVFFETTREDKIQRIKSINCTHFIDDLLEVFTTPSFPQAVRRILFLPNQELLDKPIDYPACANWSEVTHALFS